MDNLANYIFIGLMITVSVLILFINRRRDNSVIRDPGEALVEFGNVFPDEAIRGVLMDKKGQAAFIRLADGKTGLAQIINDKYVIRLIVPGDVEVDFNQKGDGLFLKFKNGGMMGGEYQFLSAEDSKEVFVWLCGRFSHEMVEKPVSGKTDSND